jgi:hypothetical protein
MVQAVTGQEGDLAGARLADDRADRERSARRTVRRVDVDERRVGEELIEARPTDHPELDVHRGTLIRRTETPV